MKDSRLVRAVSTVAAVAAVALVAAGAAVAKGGGTLSLTVLPGTLAPGGSGAVVATLSNPGPSTLTDAIVTVTLPAGATFDATGSSPACTGTAPTVSCSLGNLDKGDSIQSLVAFGNGPDTGPATFDGTATWNADSHTSPHGAANPKFTTTASASADVLDVPEGAAASSCKAGGDTLSASAHLGDGDQTTQATAGENDAGLPCTPILVAVTPPVGDLRTNIAIVDLPHLTTPATVTLDFPDEFLPGGFDRHHQLPPLLELDQNNTVLGPVPACDDGAIPEGADSCILGVQVTDTDEDNDAGTITLLVQGSGSGDPRYGG